MRKREERVSTEIDPNRTYTPGELDAIATQLLRDDVKSELCRECRCRGEKTGMIRRVSSEQIDEEGYPLIVDFAELKCSNDHRWYEGEGRARGIQGESPILFEEHIQSRKRREIYTTEGTPDPHIVSGLYNRTHPAGRKVNTPEQRKKHGASWYR